MKITCYKGAGDNDFTTIEVQADTTLEAVRELLENAGFIKEGPNSTYRFIYKKDARGTRPTDEAGNINVETALQDIIVNSINNESEVKVSTVWGNDHQLVLTNTSKPQSDLVGFVCETWKNGYITVAVKLNEKDVTAKEQNKRIQAFAPLMLRDVVPTNISRGQGIENVCVCVDGTAVEFIIQSWGAVGYRYSIVPTSGPPIVSRMYHKICDNFGRMGQTNRRTWEGKGTLKTIEITGVSNIDEIIPTLKGGYSEITFTTHNMVSFTDSKGVTYASNIKPPRPSAKKALCSSSLLLKASAPKEENVVVPGDSVEPGAATPGADSTQNYGNGLRDIKIDPTPLGVVKVHFFVFKSKAEADRVIRGFNSRDINING